MQSTKTALTLACVVALAAPLTVNGNTNAPNAASAPSSASVSGSGGTLTAARQTGYNITVTGVNLAGPTGSATLACTITFFGASTYQWNWTCAGGSITIRNSSSSVVMSGRLTKATMTLTGSGGGRGGHVSYTYRLSGTFTGSLKQGSATRYISGSISTLATTRHVSDATGKVVHFTLN